MTATTYPSSPKQPETPLTRDEVKRMLRDAAFVLHLTRRVKAEMIAERPEAGTHCPRKPAAGDWPRAWVSSTVGDRAVESEAPPPRLVWLDGSVRSLLQHLDLHLPELTGWLSAWSADVALFQQHLLVLDELLRVRVLLVELRLLVLQHQFAVHEVLDRARCRSPRSPPSPTRRRCTSSTSSSCSAW